MFLIVKTKNFLAIENKCQRMDLFAIHFLKLVDFMLMVSGGVFKKISERQMYCLFTYWLVNDYCFLHSYCYCHRDIAYTIEAVGRAFAALANNK